MRPTGLRGTLTLILTPTRTPAVAPVGRTPVYVCFAQGETLRVSPGKHTSVMCKLNVVLARVYINKVLPLGFYLAMPDFFAGQKLAPL